MNFNNIITDFIIALDHALDLDACFKALEQSIEALGFSGITYTAVPIGLNLLSDASPVFLKSSQYNTRFLDHYSEANFAAEDFTIKKILAGDLSTIDWWAEEKKGLLSPAEKNVIEVARCDYHITNGITIPTFSNAHYIAGASIISEDKSLAFSKLLDERRHLLNTLVKLFHHKVHANFECRKIFYLPLLEQLSVREKLVLKFIINGVADKAVDDRYGMSTSTISNIRSELFKKFGVKKATQLAYVAGLHNLVEMI